METDTSKEVTIRPTVMHMAITGMGSYSETQMTTMFIWL